MLKDILVTEMKLFLKAVFFGFKVIIAHIKVHILHGQSGSLVGESSFDREGEKFISLRIFFSTGPKDEGSII